MRFLPVHPHLPNLEHARCFTGAAAYAKSGTVLSTPVLCCGWLEKLISQYPCFFFNLVVLNYHLKKAPVFLRGLRAQGPYKAHTKYSRQQRQKNKKRGGGGSTEVPHQPERGEKRGGSQMHGVD